MKIRRHRARNATHRFLIAPDEPICQDRFRLFPAKAERHRNREDISPEDLVRVAESFDRFLTSLDYVEDTKPWMMLIDNNDVESL